MTVPPPRPIAPDLDFTAADAPAGEPRPLLLVLPGGGYVHLADHEGAPVAAWLSGLGINALTLRYPVAPHRHPAAVDRASEVLAAVRGGALGLGGGVDPSRVGVLGFSAGGHLAAELSNLPVPAAGEPGRTARPDLAVLAYPVISMVHEPHIGSLESLLGADSAPAARRALSHELRVDTATPPTFLWHTADDAVVPVSHSLRYADALAGHGVPFALHVFEHGAHGAGLGRGGGALQDWTVLCAAWLRERGWASDEGADDRSGA